MTRTIKFRAWTGQMQYDIMVWRFWIFYVNPWEKWDWLDVKDTASLTQFTTKIDEKSCQIMQFTWLLDKNGKEIYEGDIIREWTPPDSWFWPCNILYQIWYYWDWYYLYNYFFKAFITNIKLRTFAEHCEIIWNIYENPELLQNE